MLDLGTFTAVRTILSLVAIVSGLGAVAAFFWPATHPLWTSTFLVTAMLTSVTGFFFPFEGLLPSHILLGAIAVVVLAAVLAARYPFALRGIWRAVYAGGMVASEYLLVFVLVTQAFDKVPALNALARTQSEPLFAVAQLVVLVVFGYIGFPATRRFRAAPAH